MADKDQADKNQAENKKWTPKYSPWLIAAVVAMAAFMEVLDTSIANVALPHIAGSLGATQDESTWVLTSYLVSNAIILPITGWISSIVGRKRFFLICLGVFTVASFLCGLAPSLGILLLARIIQGAGGGGLQPMAQAIRADSFPPEKRSLAFSIYGLTAVVAPSLGPTLGGWITDTYSWRWIFFINIPVGLLTVFLVSHLVEDPPFLRRRTLKESKFDYLGLSALALGVGALQVMLDKGQEDDWFSSPFILTLALTSLISLVFLVLWEWFQDDPLIDVRLFKSINFTSTCLIMFMVGVVSFATTVLMPQFLQTLMGYTAEKAGVVLSVAAVVLIIEMPIVGWLTSKIQGRFVMAFGWAFVAVSMYISVYEMNLYMSFKTATILRIWQYAPVGFIFIPATTIAYIGLPQEKSDSIAGLINFMRNLGSGVGTSAVTTILAQRSQFHQARLANYTDPSNPNFTSMVNGAAQTAQQTVGFGQADANQAGIAGVYQTLLNQASSLSYLDVFQILFILGVVMFIVSLFLKANDPSESSGGAL